MSARPHTADSVLHCHLLFRAGRSRQEGAVLIVSLVILVVLTLLGLNAMQTATLEERMSGYQRDRATAFAAAELGVSEAERWLHGKDLHRSVPEPQPGCGQVPCDLYRLDPTLDFLGKDDRWWRAHAHTYAGPRGQSGARPEYHIDFGQDLAIRGRLNTEGNSVQETHVDYYRITARGQGAMQQKVGKEVRRSSQVVLQTTYAVPEYGLK